MPSEYFRENVDTTFQDDWVAFQVKDLILHDNVADLYRLEI